MNEYPQFNGHSLLLAIIESLNRHGSWTGKTHVQKTTFLLKSIVQEEVPFEFVLYKHGPYSFEVEEALELMKAYQAIVAIPNPVGYGVNIHLGKNEEWLKQEEPISGALLESIDKLCTWVDSRDVKELEPLATAAWIKTTEHVEAEDAIVARLLELKPHIPRDMAIKATSDILRYP
ncbi:MAG: hypothetical protein ACE14V_10020 [bacterium]